MEEWRVIPGYPGFEVSDKGRVRTCGRTYVRRYGWSSGFGLWTAKPRILAQHLNGKPGYKYRAVNLCLGRGKVKIEKVHRLVCLAFKGLPPTPEHGVNHRDFDRFNNDQVNLEWATNAENMAHRYQKAA
jgi:hypothetical protein